MPTITTEVEVEVEVNMTDVIDDLSCNTCGEYLGWNNESGSVYVEPCDNCLEEAYREGKDDGQETQTIKLEEYVDAKL